LIPERMLILEGERRRTPSDDQQETQ